MRLALLVLGALALTLAGCSDSSGPGDVNDPPYPEIPGLIVFYEFDGSLENEVADEHHGTAARAVIYVPDRDGAADGAIHVDANDEVTVADHADFDITEELTLAAWVSPEASDQAYAGLIDKSYTEAYSFGMWGGITDPDTTRMIGYITDSSGGSDPLIPMGTGVWSHVAMTFSGAENRLRFYFNGSLVATLGSEPSIGVSDEDLRIGRSYAGDRYKGRIDEVAVFDRELTAEEIEELYEFD